MATARSSLVADASPAVPVPPVAYRRRVAPVAYGARIPAASGPFRAQLLKWIGNKQRLAGAIIAHFPQHFGTYYEPFLGGGGVLGVLAPERAIASDGFLPLVEIWHCLVRDREALKRHYADRYALIARLGKKSAYEEVLRSYNARPNGADLVFLCRACYGGVVRFRKQDGYMSTPVGTHAPHSAGTFCRPGRRLAPPNARRPVPSPGFRRSHEPRRRRRSGLLRSAVHRQPDDSLRRPVVLAGSIVRGDRRLQSARRAGRAQHRRNEILGPSALRCPRTQRALCERRAHRRRTLDAEAVPDGRKDLGGTRGHGPAAAHSTDVGHAAGT